MIALQNKGNLVLAIEEYISNLSLIKELILKSIPKFYGEVVALWVIPGSLV